MSRGGRLPIPGLHAIAMVGSLALVAPPAEAIDIQALVGRLEALRTQHGVAGVGLVMVAEGRVLHEGGLGIADRAAGRPADSRTLWRIGSVTKSFTALATLVAARDHGFSLEDPVRALVPDAPFDNPWEATDPVRVVHLLEHTAGFLDLTRKEFDSSDPTPLSLAEAFAVDPPSRVLRWKPGRYSSYSNSGAGIAALVVERRTGRRFEDFLTARILAPLGMTETAFFPGPPGRERLAAGYDRDGVTPIPYWHTLYPAFGGLDASLGDMGRYLRWLIDPASVPILAPDLVRQMARPRSTLSGAAGLEYGYGLGLYGYAHDGIVLTGHGGDADGYLSRLGLHRQSGRGYFLVINANHGDALEAMQGAVEDALFGDVPREPPPPVHPMDATALQRLAGCYVPVTHRFANEDPSDDVALRVEVEAGRLFTVTAGGRRKALIPVTERFFRRQNEPVATSAFVDDAGTLMLQGDMGNLRRSADGGCGGG
jgi:CubicO group peptidase (beta-lactamase class C family)